jgi:hypothetical protein
MNIVQFGSDAEHIKIQIPESFSLEGWAQTSVEIKVNGFCGVITPYFNTEDFELFLPNLRKLYESLKGSAEFIPLEKQLVLTFEGKSGGHISISGTAWSQASYENKLEFSIEIDQSYLQEPIKILERLVTKNKSNA